MVTEIASTARPTRLRLAGFASLALGGLLVALGSLLDWARIQPFDTPTRGVDLWEGTVTLAVGVAVLVGIVGMRLARSAGVRRAVAIAIVVGGLAATGLAGWDALHTDRFTSPGQRDRLARTLAADLHLPVQVVRARLDTVFRERFHVSLQPAIFLVMAGGLIVFLGGGLSVAWAGRSATPSTDPRTSA